MSTKYPVRTLQQVKADLHNILTSQVSNRSKLANWLESLIADTAGGLLCINLCIDLENGYLDPPVVASVIDQMAFPENDARWAFYKFAEENQHQAFFKHLGGPQLLAGNQYVRTLPLLDLIEYYLRKPLGLPAAHEAEREVMEMFFELPEEERENLGVVQEVWSGRLPIVWVTDRALCGPPQCPAGEVGDRLGLYGLKACKLVSIIYPSDFDRARSFVPTTLDAPFGAVFYLSVTPASGWGLTCSLTPSYTGVRERVHESFAGGLSEEFELLYVGPVEVDPKPDFDHLMMQGLIRVQ